MPRSKKPSPSQSHDGETLPNVNPASPETHRGADQPFLIVGVGASAGGVEALTQLVGGLSADAPLALVVVQHLDPARPSLMPEILTQSSRLPVKFAEHKQRLEPGHVYVMPPGRDLVLGDRLLQLSPRTEEKGEHRPIDRFLRSLAEEQTHKAVAVILSGAGSDGALGVEEVKSAGGITFAQDKTAEFSAMPRHAVASGAVDFVLPPQEIARELERIASSAWLDRSPDEERGNEPALHAVLETLRNGMGVDFTQYKRNTLSRRIARRMVVHKLESLKDYAGILRKNPAEVEALYQDILINVTSFFRNPESYEALKQKVFPRLTEAKNRHHPVRVWTLGCSTGEEAYSIAMTYTEYAEASGRRVPMQIFATDLNGAGIEKARAGVYRKGIEQDVSPERLRRFFIEVDGNYRVCKPIRDMCVFARQNVLSDPPFSRLDLIACRNMLIYLEPGLQRKLMPVLHYALQREGMLWLGSSETIGSFRELFEVEDAKHKIYTKKPSKNLTGLVPVQRAAPVDGPKATAASIVPAAPSADPHREADRIVLSRFGPPGVLVNAQLDIVQFRGDTGPYLTPAPGRAAFNLLKMLREGLAIGVRNAIKKAQKNMATARVADLRVKVNGAFREVAVTVTPLTIPGNEAMLLVLFEDESSPRRAEPPPAPLPPAASQKEIERLNQELAANRDYLQSVIEQQEAVNEELQSANEEVQSANEELQSINEELETSKEEIQSSNEELATVNDELQNRNAELSDTNNDLTNLLSSAQTAIVMLGRDLRIRRYTPAAEKLLNLIPTDIGRPFNDIKPRFDAPHLEKQLFEVIDTVSVHEREIQDFNGRWYLLRLRPYQTLENKIDGVVLMLVDVDSIKRAAEQARESEARFRLLADATPAMIWSNNLQGCEFANRAMQEFTGVPESELLGLGWLQFVHPEDREHYSGAYMDALARRAPFAAQCRMRRADGKYRRIQSNAQPRLDASGAMLGLAGCGIDIGAADGPA
ncbi:MAG TPA: chemotaxis protein CheB [Verrucomicrobiae bacterium]|nr:chemotaxis protein CheB [Verrucomicrobiae bacterium]